MAPTRSRTYPSNSSDERTPFLEAIAYPDAVAIAIFCARLARHPQRAAALPGLGGASDLDTVWDCPGKCSVG
jgi:hypothetical protein